MPDFKQKIIFEIAGEEQFNKIKNVLEETFKRFGASGTESLKNLNSSIDNILKSLDQLSKADSSLSKLPEVFRNNINKITDILNKQLGIALQETEARLERLINRLESLQMRRGRAMERGDERMISLYNQMETRLMREITEATTAATQGRVAAETLRGATAAAATMDPTGAKRASDLTGAAVAMGGAVAGGALLSGLTTSGFGAGLLAATLPGGMGLLASRLLGFGTGPYAIVGAIVGQTIHSLYQRATPMAEYAGEATRLSYQMLAGREAMQMDIRRRLTEAIGMSPEALMRGEQGIGTAILTRVPLISRFVTRTLLGGQTWSQTYYQYMKELSDKAIAARPALELFTKNLTDIETGLTPELRMFGPSNVYSFLRRVTTLTPTFGGRLEALNFQASAELLRGFSRLGLSPQAISNQQLIQLALSGIQWGVGPSLQAFMFRRAITGADTTAEVQRLFGAAGLVGRITVPARQMLGEAIAQYMSTVGAEFAPGTANIAQYGATFAGVHLGIQQALQGAGITGVSPVDTMRMAIQTTQQFQKRIQSAGDPMQRLTMAALMGLGFNTYEAMLLLKADPTAQRTQKAIATILEKQGYQGITSADVGKMLQRTVLAPQEVLTRTMENFLSDELLEAFGLARTAGEGISVAGQMILEGGPITPAKARARVGALQKLFRPAEIEKAPLAEITRETTADIRRREEANQLNASIQAISENYGVILESISGSSREQVKQLEDINQTLQRIANSIDGRFTVNQASLDRPLQTSSSTMISNAIQAAIRAQGAKLTPQGTQYLEDIYRRYPSTDIASEINALSQNPPEPTYPDLFQEAGRKIQLRQKEREFQLLQSAAKSPRGIGAASWTVEKMGRDIQNLKAASPTTPRVTKAFE